MIATMHYPNGYNWLNDWDEKQSILGYKWNSWLLHYDVEVVEVSEDKKDIWVEKCEEKI